MSDNEREKVFSTQVDVFKTLNLDLRRLNTSYTGLPTGVMKLELQPQPYNFENLMYLIDLDPTHQACINLKLSMVVGMGFDFINKEEVEKNQEFKDFLNSPNVRYGVTFMDIVKNHYFDKLITNNSYLEVRRGSKLNVYNLKADKMYIKAKESKGVAIPGSIDKFYQVYNDHNLDPKAFAIYEGMTSPYKSYCYHFKGVNSNNDFYGTPSYLSILKAIEENMYITEYDIEYFNNNGRPNALFSIIGEDLSKKEKEALEDTFSKTKGFGNQHRSVLLSLVNERAKVQVDKISQDVDGSFRNLKIDNRDLIAMVHNIPPKILGINQGSSFGGGSADIGALKSLMETTIKPEQVALEEYWNRLFESEFGFNPKLKFKALDTTSAKDDAVFFNLLFNMQDEEGRRAMGVNEIRERIKLPMIEGVVRPHIMNNDKLNVNQSGDVYGQELDAERSITNLKQED